WGLYDKSQDCEHEDWYCTDGYCCGSLLLHSDTIHLSCHHYRSRVGDRFKVQVPAEGNQAAAERQLGQSVTLGWRAHRSGGAWRYHQGIACKTVREFLPERQPGVWRRPGACSTA